MAFALPSGAPARLDLLDVNGRRVLSREVGSLGAGRHTANLADRRRVTPGVYWVRLTQGTNRQTTRVAVIEWPFRSAGTETAIHIKRDKWSRFASLPVPFRTL